MVESHPAGSRPADWSSQVLASAEYLDRVLIAPCLPLRLPPRTPAAGREEVGAGLFGNEEHRLERPAERLLRRLQVRRPERFPMSFPRVLDRAPVPEVGPNADEGGASGFGASRVQRGLDRPEVVPIRYAKSLPAVGLEAFGHALGERPYGGAFEGDVVVVVEIDQLSQTERSR